LEVSISARHGTLAKDAHDYIERKLPKLVHLFDRVNSAKVTVDLQSADDADVELVVSEPRHTLVSRERAATVQAAFDSAMAKMESQLRKHKEKLHNHHAGGDKHAT
jgi:putative sigma-54 modulation protein